ncbi:MAG: hypothetical protein ACNI27_15630 [Desulfovibrio sp.]
MDPRTLIPAAPVIPVSWQWIDLLQVVTFTAHIIAMSMVFGGGLICLVQILRNRNIDLAEVLTNRLPTGLAITINLGVAPLLFLQALHGQFYFTSTILTGGYWLTMVLLVGLAYTLFYVHQSRFKAGRGTIIPLSLALLLMVCVGFILSSNMSLMIAPQYWVEYFEKDGGFLNFTDPTLIPRYLHFICGAPAIAGIGIALFGKFRRRLDWERLGLKWFVHSTILSIFTGVWFLLALPTNVMSWFAGGSAEATFVLVGGTVLALMGMGAALRGKTTMAAAMVYPSIVLMAESRDQLRFISLNPWFHPGDLVSADQLGAPMVFLFFFVLGLGVIYWLIKSWYNVNYEER